MKATLLVVAVVVLQGASAALALERIKKKPPTPAETERIASDEAMNDGTLQKGDIIRTDRGFFVYRGIGPDGYTGDFAPVANPFATKPK
jgi:hypothetical protein